MSTREAERRLSPQKKSTSTSSVKGILHEYADLSKIPLEETAWAEAAAEKHLKFLEELKAEQSNQT